MSISLKSFLKAACFLCLLCCGLLQAGCSDDHPNMPYDNSLEDSVNSLGSLSLKLTWNSAGDPDHDLRYAVYQSNFPNINTVDEMLVHGTKAGSGRVDKSECFEDVTGKTCASVKHRADINLAPGSANYYNVMVTCPDQGNSKAYEMTDKILAKGVVVQDPDLTIEELTQTSARISWRKAISQFVPVYKVTYGRLTEIVASENFERGKPGYFNYGDVYARGKTIDTYYNVLHSVPYTDIPGLTPGGRYFIEVTATDFLGAITKYDTLFFTTPKKKPLLIKEVAHDFVTLDWEAVYKPADPNWTVDYQLKLSEPGNGNIRVKNLSNRILATGSKRTIYGLRPDSHYRAELTAIDSAGKTIEYSSAAFSTPLDPLGYDSPFDFFNYEVTKNGVKLKYFANGPAGDPMIYTFTWLDAASAVAMAIQWGWDRYQQDQERAFLSKNFNMLAMMISQMTNKITNHMNEIVKSEVKVELGALYENSRNYFKEEAIEPMGAHYVIRPYEYEDLRNDVDKDTVGLLHSLKTLYDDKIYAPGEWPYIFQHYLSLSTLQQMLKVDLRNGQFYHFMYDFDASEEEARASVEDKLERDLRDALGSRLPFLNELFKLEMTERLNPMFSSLAVNHYDYNCSQSAKYKLGGYVALGERFEIHALCERKSGPNTCMTVGPPCKIIHKNVDSGKTLPVDKYADIAGDLWNFASENKRYVIDAIAPFIYQRHKQSKLYLEAQIQPAAAGMVQKWIHNYRLLPGYDSSKILDATPDFVTEILSKGMPSPYSGCPDHFKLEKYDTVVGVSGEEEKFEKEDWECEPIGTYTGRISVRNGGAMEWVSLTTEDGYEYFLTGALVEKIKNGHLGELVTARGTLRMESYPETLFLNVESYERPLTVHSLKPSWMQVYDNGGNPHSVSFSLPRPVMARAVKVILLGPDRGTENYLSLAEVWILGEKNGEKWVNLAREPGTTAFQSTTGWGGVAGRAIDGNIDGNYGANSVSHTGQSNNGTHPHAWGVELAKSHRIRRIVLHNRTDCCGNRLNNFRVSVLDVAGEEVWRQDYHKVVP